MTSNSVPLGIKYPERAESLDSFGGYKVFVDFWGPLIENLSEQYRRLALRNETRVLGIYGPQGSGKTMFSHQLLEDHKSTQAMVPAVLHTENLWHRIASGAGSTPEALSESTSKTIINDVPSSANWVTEVIKWKGAGSSKIVAVADNAETHYFLQGLTEERIPNARRDDPVALTVAAERLVQLARKEMSGVLLIMLSNDETYLRDFQKEVESQHEGLMKISMLPLPSPADKERAVRVNINRLNDVSYWYCLDKGGLPQKREIQSRLSDATTFPKAFEAVDKALEYGSNRPGRPPRKNLLTLVCMANESSFNLPSLTLSDNYELEAESDWAASILLNTGWASKCGLATHDANLLESEWQLRMVFLGDPFVSALLAAHPLDSVDSTWSQGAHNLCAEMLTIFQTPLGPTSLVAARNKYKEAVAKLVGSWIGDLNQGDSRLQAFWGQGQSRSVAYEQQLKSILTNYNVTTPGFGSARPDYVVEDFVPCSLSSAANADKNAIEKAIQRNAHAMEFTAQANPTATTLANYLKVKLPGYVSATQDQ